MNDKTFMGRVYLPPAPSAELHINIGWNTKDGQMYPEWMPIFEEAISKQDYERLISKIKEYFETNTINPCLPICAVMTCSCCIGCCVGCYVYSKAKGITKHLKQIGDEYASARVELYQSTLPTALTPDSQSFDQYGKPLQMVFGASKHSAGTLKPCWPPLGYNIILKAPKTLDLRSIWPNNYGVSMGPCPVVGVNMERIHPGGDDPTEKLMKLKGLLDAGALTQGEYDEKKGLLLEKF